MPQRIVGRARLHAAALKCSRLQFALLLLPWVFAHAAATQAAGGGRPPTTSSTRRQVAAAESAPAVTTLELHKTVERELSGGQSHTYQLALNRGQYASVTVEQRGLDVAARLFAADGRLFAELDSERTPRGTETLELVAGAGGNYKIEIAPSLPTADAGSYAIRLSEAREATADEALLHEARRQYYESLRLDASGKTDQALELAGRALETREKILGTEHADVAASLRGLGALHLVKNDPASAEAFFRRAAEATAKASGADSLDYADVLQGLGRARSARGDRAQAEQLHQRALSVREKAAGPDSLAASYSLHYLAALYRAANDLPKAERTFLRAQAIREKLLGADHPEMAPVFNDLGLLYYGAGDYRSAEPLLLRALALREKAFGPDHTHVGVTLNNLGLLEWKKGDYEKAEAYHLRALSIFEKNTGPESDRVAGSLHNLGIIHKEAGKDYARAEEFYRRALTISEKIYGEYNSITGDAVHSLGILYQAMGDNDRAEKSYLRALAIREGTNGPNNHYTILVLRSLAKLYAAKDDIGRATEYQSRISAIEEKVIPLNMTIGSERQKATYFTQLQKPDRVISLHVNLAGGDRAARDLAITTVLQRKGRVLDALSENLSALRRRFGAQDRVLLDDLTEISARLARLVLNKPQKMSAEEHQSRIKTLEGEREKLEAEIGRRSAGFYEGSRPVTLAAVRAALPEGAALAEFAVYRPFDWKAAEAKAGYGEPRYVAYVIRGRGEAGWRELGPAKEIDAAVGAWRRALRDPKRKDARRLARALDERLMRPVRALVGDATQLLVSPDGELNLIPFEALVDEQGRHLIERYSVTYLTSGRDLLRRRAARAGGGRPWVVADPAFGDPGSDQLAGAARPAARRDARRSVTAARSLAETYFAPLGGTAQEAQAIRSLFPDATLLTGAGATEAALKRAEAPSVLHLATHGFFLQDAPAAGRAQAAARAASANAAAGIENPLLRSGLALAGANRRGEAAGGAGEDGILTALEASGLNLWGTKLVVLSACDTGLGEVRSGEGVYGLRRAFALAGAESLVMTLWPVSDHATRRLMAQYYKNLKGGMGRGEALRQVRLDMLKRDPQLHPFYWANFIQSGEWADLEEIR
jgi:CHAT domain-containing protein/Tfp pilus assembly protein PilF